MVISYSAVQKVRFPVYALKSGNWDRQDGLLSIEGKIVDDKNMPGDTLGIRRLQTPHKNLYELRAQIDTLRGIIKNNSPYFIDSHGMPFIYEKTKFCTLKYYKIKKVIPKEDCSLLVIDKVKQRFVVPRPPDENMGYAGVLHYGELPWILYSYTEAKLADTKRKV
tara:strand:- start:939 stop:1433 length:495 start_codon:yes stop_codon:yes gene_type:complete